MADDHQAKPKPKTQKTQPKEGEPIEIPVPKERDIEGLISRAAKGKGDD
jgi:hypothetical protein